MFCRNCASNVNDGAVICVNCGVEVGKGAAYCPNCAEPTSPDALICTKCGYSLAPSVKTGAKSKMTAGLLGIFLGGFGVHNFYLGNTTRAIIQIVVTLVTCGAGSLWGLIEGIMILIGKIDTDAEGNKLAD